MLPSSKIPFPVLGLISLLELPLPFQETDAQPRAHSPHSGFHRGKVTPKVLAGAWSRDVSSAQGALRASALRSALTSCLFPMQFEVLT